MSNELNKVISRAAEHTDLDESCRIIQDYFKQTDGGLAGDFFSGSTNVFAWNAVTPCATWGEAWKHMEQEARFAKLEEYAGREEANYVDTLAVEAVAMLAKRGITAYWEFPGYICAPLPDGKRYAICGRANGVWETAVLEADGNQIAGELEANCLPLLSMSDEVADFLTKEVIAQLTVARWDADKAKK